jgi:hypothetical protein
MTRADCRESVLKKFGQTLVERIQVLIDDRQMVGLAGKLISQMAIVGHTRIGGLFPLCCKTVVRGYLGGHSNT